MHLRHLARLQTATGARHSGFLHWLTNLGPVGLLAVAVVDSSIVPLPVPGSTDILLVLVTIHHGSWLMLALVAWAGSMVGGYFTYRVGRKGGEQVLQRYVSEKRLASVNQRVEEHSFLAVFIPTMLPPPVPLLPFLLTAGALQVSRRRFLTAYGLGRLLRYGLVGWLGALYGRHLLRKWGEFSRDWSGPITGFLLVFAISAVAFAIWKYRSQQRQHAADAPPAKAAETKQVPAA